MTIAVFASSDDLLVMTICSSFGTLPTLRRPASEPMPLLVHFLQRRFLVDAYRNSRFFRTFTLP
jgi:hypothetical protein